MNRHKKGILITVIGLLLLSLATLLGHVEQGGPPGKDKLQEKQEKPQENKKVEKTTIKRQVHFAKVSVIKVPKQKGQPGTSRGTGRVYFVAKIDSRNIEAYFRHIINHGGRLVLTKGAALEVQGRVEVENNKLVFVKDKGMSLSAQGIVPRDVTSEFIRLFGKLPFGATRAILFWPREYFNTLQDVLKASGWAQEARKVYGTIHLTNGQLVIKLNRVLKKDGTYMHVDYVFAI